MANTRQPNKIIQLTQTSQQNEYIHAVQDITRQLAGNPQAELHTPTKSAAELLASIESLSAQNKTNVEIRDSPEFQQLLLSLSADPELRKGLLQRFLAVSGSPLGESLSLALAMSSSGGSELPEIKAAAVQLLRDGTAAQRLNALHLLGQTNANDANTRSLVLEVLRKDAGANPQLAMAAMATFNRQGIISQGQHQEVLGTVASLVHNQDPQVRQNSLQVLSQWAGRDQAALQTFTEATNDADPGVRSLAISALGRGGFAYESVRDTLLTTLQNPNENPDVKASAQQVLEGFPLDEQALAIYQAHISNPLYQQQGSQVGFN